MAYYLTDTLFIKNGETFCNSKKLTKHNWHNYLSDYGWIKLCLGWKRRLKEDTSKNSCFGLLECGSDGDCLFHVLCEALNSQYLEKLRLPKYDVSKLRQLSASAINKDNFKFIIESYKLDYEENEYNFLGEWDPNEINTVSKLKDVIINSNIWGDHILLQLLQKKLKFNIIILNSENNSDSKNIDDRFTVHPTASLDNNEKTIIIYYLNQYHFQLIGYFNGHIMKTLFNKDELPTIILDIYNNDCRN
jgi:hypothetical protein